jgi:hypothetical protein
MAAWSAEAPDGDPSSSLDCTTELSEAVVRAVPDAGEALVYVPRAVPDEVERQTRKAKREKARAAMSDEEGQAYDEERAAKNWKRANDRAKGRSRRYIAANGLNLMWVLTRAGGYGLHGPEGRAMIMELTAELVETLRGTAWRGHRAGEAFPAWYSPELHRAEHGESRETCPIPDRCGCAGHGWHLNLFLGFDWLPIEMLKRLWQEVDEGNGYQIRYRDWTKGHEDKNKPRLERLRDGASYGTKYASKDWGPDVVPAAAHRYEVTEGFQPLEVKYHCGSLEEAEAVVRSISGVRDLVPVWASEDLEDWDGPECYGYRWSPPDGDAEESAGG